MVEPALTDQPSIPLSALQHQLYCPRQCALIHLERIWTENVFTAQGRAMHQRVDKRGAVGRGCVRRVTALPLVHDELGLHGVADVVEFHRLANGVERVLPIEYKRGKPKAHRADEVQLCAQALCLERMLGVMIEAGALFYGEPKRRTEVPMDDELRSLTMDVVKQVRAMLLSGNTPAAHHEPRRCNACSLLTDCRPKLLGQANSVSAWLHRQLAINDRSDID